LFRWLIVLLVVLAAAGCALVPLPDAPDERLFWPPVDDPKIEYIAFYESTWDLERGAEKMIEWALVGRPKARSLFDRPNNLTADDPNRVLVADVAQKTVLVLDLAKHEQRNLLGLEGQRYLSKFPGWLAVDGAGGIYLSESLDQKISYFGADERFRFDFGRGHLKKPCGVVVDERHGRVLVADSALHQVIIFDPRGGYLGAFGGRGDQPGRFNYPLDIDLDPAGNIYVLDALNARVQVFDPELNFLRTIGARGAEGAGLQIPKGVAVSPEGHVYITDSMARNIKVFDAQGHFLLLLGGPYNGPNSKLSPGGFIMPAGIDVNAKGEIWVADSVARLLQRFQYLNEDYLRENPL